MLKTDVEGLQKGSLETRQQLAEISKSQNRLGREIPERAWSLPLSVNPALIISGLVLILPSRP